MDKFFKALFGQSKIEPKDTESVGAKPLGVIGRIPKLGDKGSDVEAVQKALKVKGYAIKVDGDFGPDTEEVIRRFQRDQGLQGSGVMGPKTIGHLRLKVVKQEPTGDGKAPWFWNLKKHEGQIETNSKFSAFMTGFWKKVGLPGFKGISGSARAWCGLFIAAGLIGVGLNYQHDGAGAKNWDKFGIAVDWKSNGFWQGAIVRINNKGKCSSGSGNHVTLANGDCTAKDLVKSGATFSGYGGNQGNKAKVSTYTVNKICSVRWPADKPLPSKVTLSINCSNGKTSNESTR